jgi:hypothetical protein
VDRTSVKSVTCRRQYKRYFSNASEDMWYYFFDFPTFESIWAVYILRTSELTEIVVWLPLLFVAVVARCVPFTSPDRVVYENSGCAMRSASFVSSLLMNIRVHKSLVRFYFGLFMGTRLPKLYQLCRVSVEECGPIKKNVGDRVGDRVEDGATMGTLFVLDSTLENGR